MTGTKTAKIAHRALKAALVAVGVAILSIGAGTAGAVDLDALTRLNQKLFGTAAQPKVALARASARTDASLTSSDTLWFDDAVPAGAIQTGTGESWTWVSSSPAPASGALAHQSANLAGLHQHYFYGATSPMVPAAGDTLFVYVYLDPDNPPTELMLQWNDGNWDHRAYWGDNRIDWGTDGTASRRSIGSLPPTGQWVRLEVPAALVGLEGRPINGMAFTLYGGRAWWDAAGKTSQTAISGAITSGGRPLSGVSVDGGAGTTCTSTDATGSYVCSVPAAYSGTVTPMLSGYTFDPPTRTFSNVTTSLAGQDFTAVAVAAAEVVWIEDAVPPGAAQSGAGETWAWISSNPSPFSGSLAHASAVAAGLHQHYFAGASNTLSIKAGDSLFAYVYLDPANPPTELMLQWNDGSWEHRAYWGANQIAWGTDGTGSRRYMGPLPAVGGWVKLVVPAAQVDLEGRTLNGMAYTLYGGRAFWDRAGKMTGSASTFTLSGRVVVSGQPLGNAPLVATNGASCTVTDANGQYGCTVPANWSGTVSPVLAGYDFAPASRSYTAVAADATGQDFSATVQSHAITGTVMLEASPLAGVTMAISGNASACTPTDASGRYRCSVPGGWSGSITPSLVGYAFTPAARSFSNVTVAQSSQDFAATGAGVVESIWLEDSAPAGAALATSGDSWSWISANPAPYSGALAHASATMPGMHQHYFTGATARLAVNAGDTLFTYVYLDPANPPTEVMLQWNDGTWEHRAYWGANQIDWGVSGTTSRRYMGPLPPTGSWVRLEVPAALVGLEGRTLTGMAFTLYGGRAVWDRAGKFGGSASTYILSGRVLSGGMALSGVAVQGTVGASCTTTDATGSYSCSVPTGWSGTTSPVLAGYSLTPAARSYSSISASQSGQDFLATPLSYQIGGTISAGGVPLAGVALAAGAGISCTASDTLGRYVCSVPYSWSGSITPSVAGYSFTPASRSYSGVTSSQTGQTFDAAVSQVQITGNVLAGAAPLASVAIAASNGGTCTPTDAAGAYTCRVPYNWSGVVTPAHAGYGFAPSSRAFTALVANQTGQGFVATEAGAGVPVFVAAVSAPNDGGSQLGPLLTVAPPSGMVAGDLVVLIVQSPLSGTNDVLIARKGGQQWSSFDATYSPNGAAYVRIYWARFSGTWTDDLVVRSPGGVAGRPMTAQLQVYRASDQSKWWVPDNWGHRTAGFAAPGSLSAVALPGITTVKPDTVSIAVWASPGTPTWSGPPGGNWTKAGLGSQVRNIGGTGLSLTSAYQLRSTIGATGDASQLQSDVSAEGAYSVVSFAAVDLPQGGRAGVPVARVQSKSMQGGGSRTLTLTLDAPVSPGNMVVGYVYFETWFARIKGPIVDDQGNEYTVIQAVDTTEVTQIGVLFFRPNITNAPRTISVTVEGANALFAGMLAHEVQGKLALDAYTADWLPSGDGFAPGVISTTQTMTTSSNGDYIFCVAETVAQSPLLPYFDFSAWASARVVEERRSSDSSNTFASADMIQTTAGPFACTAAVPFGRTAFIMSAAFKPLP